MRYTPTLKLSTRLTAFITIIVVGAIFILFVGGTLSYQSLSKAHLTRAIEGIVLEIDKESMNERSRQSLSQWLPRLAQANQLTEIKILSQDGLFYHYVNTTSAADPSRQHEMTYSLKNSPGHLIEIKASSVYTDQSQSLSALSSISLAIALILFCLMRGVAWLKTQLKGSELLEERGRMLLAGRVSQFAKGDHQEWPYTASQALDVLIEELQYARQERSRFDTFIRTHIFLDQLTGAANRVLFDSKLESILQESGAMGGVLLFRIFDWDNLSEAIDKKRCDEFIVEVGRVISNIVQRFPDVVFARYYESDFAVLIPHQTSKDIAVLANQCIRQLDKIVLLEPMDSENWCHIGITMYSEGERRGHILSEVETALKSAQLQNSNNWSRFAKKEIVGDARGTVRWRTLFDKSFVNKKVLIFEQPCYLYDRESGKTSLLHTELFARIEDEGVGILKASRFMSAIEQVGYQSHMDQLVVSTILKYLKTISFSTCYSMNLHVQPFKDKAHVRWLRDELLQLTADTRSKLSIEFVEGQLAQHLDFMRPVVRMIVGLGCTVIAGQSGRTITSTHYIKDLEVSYLKLHRSLVKKIEQRQENQLFIRSLIGACEGTATQVIAVGVERGKEWNALLDLGVHGGQGRMFQAEKQLIPKPEAPRTQIGRRNRWRKKY